MKLRNVNQLEQLVKEIVFKKEAIETMKNGKQDEATLAYIEIEIFHLERMEAEYLIHERIQLDFVGEDIQKAIALLTD
ncbi:MAG: hypothetical protein IZT56_09435 [Bacteroidetes bacterium]|nr:hypothetical protein [Bacteroidota bacterium]